MKIDVGNAIVFDPGLVAETVYYIAQTALKGAEDSGLQVFVSFPVELNQKNPDEALSSDEPAVVTVVSDRSSELRAALAQRGRERVLARYTQARIAAQTYQVYQELQDQESLTR